MRMKILKLRCKDYEDQVVALRKRLENNIEVIKGLSEFVSPLIKKVAILETKVKELEVQCASHVDLFIFPEEEKIHLSKELGKLQEELSNAKMRVVVTYSTSQEYHNDLGLYYVWGFEHFCTQALAAFKDFDFSNFEINLEEGSSTTMVGDGAEQGGDNVVDEETKGDDQTRRQT